MTHLLLMISWKPTLAIVTEEELNNKKESTLYRDSIQPCMFFWHSFLQGDNYFAYTLKYPPMYFRGFQLIIIIIIIVVIF